MRLFYLFILFTLFFSSQTVFAAVSTPVSSRCNINTTLRLGSRGIEVECLQAVVGATMDGKFGPLTKNLVMIWQSSNRLTSDGVFGPRSRLVFNEVFFSNTNYPKGCVSATGYSPLDGTKCDSSFKPKVEEILSDISSPADNTSTSVVKYPKVFSVSPEKVRSGDIVKIYGENFSSTGNTVRLRYAQIEARFENLVSSDGKIISFTYQPPEVKTMNKEELLDLPSATLNKILDPMKAAGGSIDDIVAPYRNMKNEDDLRKLLSGNGHTFDELYDKFYVTIENKYGQGSSGGPILAGLRKLSFGSNSSLSKKDFVSSIFLSLSEFFAPKKTYAQMPEGGINSGVIMYCTCGPGYLTTMVDFSTNGGSGLYWWAPGFRPLVGDPIKPGPQLGFFTRNGGQCSMNAGTSCFTITANIANLPWGEAP